ncbi:hypothetical protein [Streptomyces sp. NK08204]|uniref:hypothetical protein n=1 Tax=Streptomyces sp. NK08204 TaxID=2873260 RepID=UPI001CEDB2A9|nr:hypothetical protein [Streptomyces sp. NK08204]
MNTSGTRVTIGATGLAAIVGSTLTGRGIITDNLPQVVGGSCITMAGLVIVVLVLIRGWIVDTTDARNALAAAQRRADDERARYQALQMGLEGEQGRLNRDMAAERARIAASLLAERARLREEFEEERARLASEAFETGAMMERAGMLKADAELVRGNLIPFPKQPDHAAERERSREHGPERERSREHGIVGP